MGSDQTAPLGGSSLIRVHSVCFLDHRVEEFDPGQAQCFVGPELGPNCLQILSADDPSR